MDIPAPRERPPIARKHCRHYEYRHAGIDDHRRGDYGGPNCKIGIDLTAPGASGCCMPDPKSACQSRQEWTEQERTATKAWSEESMLRMVAIIGHIPGSSRKNTPDAQWGKSGEFDCPGCGAGKVRWSRARSNGHCHAACTTPWCFQIIE